MNTGDRIIYTTNQDGNIVRTKTDPICSVDKINFLITCNYGDWSGFRTLSECTAQIPELEDSIQKRIQRGVYPGYYNIVERL